MARINAAELPKILNGWDYIVFLIDREADTNTGLDKNIDIGDALVCIKRIVKRFNIEPSALYAALKSPQKRYS